MNKPVLDYARKPRFRLKPVCGLAAASLILLMLYMLVRHFVGFEPDSLVVDRMLALDGKKAFFVKLGLFVLFPVTLAVMGFLSIRRIRRNGRLIGITVAVVGILGNLAIVASDVITLGRMYREYF